MQLIEVHSALIIQMRLNLVAQFLLYGGISAQQQQGVTHHGGRRIEAIEQEGHGVGSTLACIEVLFPGQLHDVVEEVDAIEGLAGLQLTLPCIQRTLHEANEEDLHVLGYKS